MADPQSDVAIVAARALASHADSDAVAALHKRLGAGSERLQEVVETALADLHRADPGAFIDWMMGVDVPDRLTPAVRVLARIAHPATLPLLRELVRSRSASVRAAAARAISAIDAGEAASVFEEIAQDPSEEVRVAVVDAIAWSSASLARFAFLRRDPSARVRARLAIALGRAQGPAARSALKVLDGMAGDTSAVVRAAALSSLAGRDDAEGLRAFAEHLSLATIDTRLELRGDARARDIGARLAARLSSSADPAERKDAAVAIGAFGAPGWTECLLPALRDPAPAVRVAAVLALASVDDPRVRARIGEMCSDPDATVQDAARRSMLHTVG